MAVGGVSGGHAEYDSHPTYPLIARQS